MSKVYFDNADSTQTSPDKKGTPLYGKIRLPVGNRKPLSAVRNVDLRRLLSNEITLTKSMADSDRRVVSDPLPGRPTTFSRDLPTVLSSSRNFGTNVTSVTRLESELREPCSQTRPLATRSLREPEANMILAKKPPPEDEGSTRTTTSKPRKIATDTNPIPIGTTRPIAFTTSVLNQRSHKTAHGQVTVLPSSSLLVDFREGERRRGKAGDEVLIISPEGAQVDIYLLFSNCYAHH